jgi:4-carboxymuconolactone decarboxylase
MRSGFEFLASRPSLEPSLYQRMTQMRKPSDPEASRGLFELDRTFGQMAVNMGEAVWSIGTLSQREKALLCLMADICDHNFGLAFEMHMEMALANDVPLVDIREVIFHAAPETGYTNVLQALIRFKEVINQKQQQLEDVGPEPDHAVPRDSSLGERLDDLAPGFGATWATGVEQQWKRPHLSIKERALLSIAADVLNHTLGEPFAYRVRQALSHEVPIDHIRDTIRFVAEFSFTKAWEALERLSRL